MKSVLLCTFFSFCLVSSFSFGQAGKDNVVTISTNTDVNSVATNLTANVALGNTILQVASAANFGTGDLVMIYQAQGATVNRGANDETWGSISNMQNAGGYEFAEIAGVSGNTITLKTGVDKSYAFQNIIGVTPFNNLVQIIKVPRYKSLTVAAGATISPSPWNGKTGGVTVMEINGELNLLGTIDVSGKGFRGGAIEPVSTTNNAITIFYSTDPSDGGRKGEGIAGNKDEYTAFGGSYGRGAIGNGGGGGNGHNSAGGGGSNAYNAQHSNWTGFGFPDPAYLDYWKAETPVGAGSKMDPTKISSGGGRGGYGWSNQDQNPSIGTSKAAWGAGAIWSNGGDLRDNIGGYGGRPLDANPGKAFLGGGGGAGSHDNGKTLAGGNGGGLVYILCNGKIIGNGKINANGLDGGNDSQGTNSSSDAPSGAGAGGSVFIKATLGVGGAIQVQANGGKGGSQIFPNVEAEGAGGGGGGGYVAQFNTVPSSGISVLSNGGPTGVTTSTACKQITKLFPPNGATIGANGSSAAFPIQKTPAICSGNAATILLDPSVTVLLDAGTITWYDAPIGGTKLPNKGATWTSPVILNNKTDTIKKTYYYTSGTNGIDTRFAVDVIVNPNPIITVNDAKICPSGTAKLEAKGGSATSTYSWTLQSGDGLGSITNAATVDVKPTLTPSTYLVSVLDANSCPGKALSTVTIISVSTVLVKAHDPICIGDTAELRAYDVTDYKWKASDFTPLIPDDKFLVVAKPISTGTVTYTVTGQTPGCPATTATIDLVVNPLPTITATTTNVCLGKPATLTATGGKDNNSYVWNATPDFSPLTTNPVTFTPSTSGTTKYTVTGMDVNRCKSTGDVSLTVYPLPVLKVNSEVICSGKSIPLAITGADSYKWTPAAGLNFDDKPTVLASPTVSTSYNITGTDVKGCQSIAQSFVEVVPKIIPHVSDSVLICKGEVADLSASGGVNYLWSTFETTAAIQVKPELTKTYRVLISNKACIDSGKVKVIVKETDVLFFNPNSFTPNNHDKLNDIYQVISPNGQDIAEFTTEIFDRWGELIYRWYSLYGGWDGRLNGVPVKEDVYVYKIKIVDQCKHVYKRVGIVTVLK